MAWFAAQVSSTVDQCPGFRESSHAWVFPVVLLEVYNAKPSGKKNEPDNNPQHSKVGNEASDNSCDDKPRRMVGKEMPKTICVTQTEVPYDLPQQKKRNNRRVFNPWPHF
jgi:hypothetical protein